MNSTALKSRIEQLFIATCAYTRLASDYFTDEEEPVVPSSLFMDARAMGIPQYLNEINELVSRVHELADNELPYAIIKSPLLHLEYGFDSLPVCLDGIKFLERQNEDNLSGADYKKYLIEK